MDFIGLPSTPGNSAILVACPDALATLYCATKDQWLTVQVNGTGGPFVTIEQRDCLNGCTRNLTLREGSVATVIVTVTAETIVMSIEFIARSSLNGTALLCYSIADGEARDTNSSLIAIVGTLVNVHCGDTMKSPGHLPSTYCMEVSINYCAYFSTITNGAIV